MKKVIILFAALFVTVSAFAQKGNDGWFITVGGGANFSFDGSSVAKGLSTGTAPALTFDFGKWFNPSLGFKVGYDGLKLKNKDNFPDGVNYNTATAALMWNMLNTFGTYKPERAVNIVLYPFVGAAFGVKTSLTAGVGLEFPIRCGNVVSIVPNFKAAYLNDTIYGGDKKGCNGVGEATLALRFRF